MTLKKLFAVALLALGMFASSAPARADSLCVQLNPGTLTTSTVVDAVDAVGRQTICVPLP
jgi:hypothetical protein